MFHDVGIADRHGHQQQAGRSVRAQVRLSAVSASWPMIYQAGGNLPPVATGSNAGLGYAKGIRGQLANGLNVCVDNNVTVLGLAQATSGGTQDHIYVVPSQECHLWEDPQAPVFIRAEQPAAANLGVLLVLYGYFAYSFRRFTNATVVISCASTRDVMARPAPPWPRPPRTT